MPSNLVEQFLKPYTECVMRNQGRTRYARAHRALAMDPPRDCIDAFFKFMYPDGRLCKNDSVSPFFDPPERFTSLPEPLNLDNEIAWGMEPFLQAVFPKDKASQMLYHQVASLIGVASKKFYQDYSDYMEKNHENNKYYSFRNYIIKEQCLIDEGLIETDIYGRSYHPPFGQICESSAMGCASDSIYQAIGKGLRTLLGESTVRLLPWHQYLRNKVARGGRDLDLAIVSLEDSFNTQFILDYFKEIWVERRNEWSNARKEDNRIEGWDFDMRVVDETEELYEGWRLITDITDDGTELVILQAGQFSLPDMSDALQGNSFRIRENTFSVDLSAIPLSRKKRMEGKNRRSSNLTAFTDEEIRLNLKSLSFKDMKLVIATDDWEWHLNKYGRNKYYLLTDPTVLDEPSRLIDLFTRTVKIMCSRVGLYDIFSFFMQRAESVFTEKLWQELSDVKSWSDYYIFNLLSAAHLSPLVFGANLIPNSRLDALPEELKRKLAHHGVDYSLSIGNLWPEVFSRLTDEQIAVFLDNLPDQEDYIGTYLEDIEHDNYPVEHQGLYYVMTALQKALAFENQHIPDFGGNYLMQAFYLFRHPQDTEILEFV